MYERYKERPKGATRSTQDALCSRYLCGGISFAGTVVDRLDRTLQRLQQAEVGLAHRRYPPRTGDIGDRDEPHVSFLAVEQAAGERLVDILKPVEADDTRVRQYRAQIGGISRTVLLFHRHIERSRPE
jgi:hypothetical protein